MGQEGAGAAAGGASLGPTYEFWYRHWSRVYGTGYTDWRALYGNAAEEKWHEWSASDSDEMNRIYRQGKRLDRLAMIAKQIAIGVTVTALVWLFFSGTTYVPTH